VGRPSGGEGEGVWWVASVAGDWGHVPICVRYRGVDSI